MSNKNILKIQFITPEPEPNIAEMTEVLLKKGFRPLIDSTPADLPPGAVLLIYNCTKHTLFSIVVNEQNLRGFSYMFFNALNADPDIVQMDKEYHFKNWYYKVLMQLPEVTANPAEEVLQKLFAEVGFKNLSEATPEDLPQGCIALISDSHCRFNPVIVRVLSMSNRRLLYLRQSAQVAGDWESDVIMDHRNPLRNFSYLVIS